MSVFESVENIKNYLKDEFYKNQDLLKLIAYPSDNPLSGSDIEDVHALEGNCIFFGTSSTNFEDEAKVFLYIKYESRPHKNSPVYDDVIITFDIMFHEQLELLYDNSSRINGIMKRIEKIVCRPSAVGMGVVRSIGGNINFQVNKNYKGARYKYKTTVFAYDPNSEYYG